MMSLGRLRLGYWLAGGAVLVGCGDTDRDEIDTTTGVSAANGSSDDGPVDDTSTTAGDGSTDDGLDGSDSADGSSSDGGEGPTCEAVACGDICCELDEDCVLGACLPACSSGVRCGDELEVCCGEGEVCLQPSCIEPGIECTDSFDCPEGEFCEPTLMRCLPQQDPVLCEVEPEFAEVSAELEWAFTELQVLSMPVVGDINGDDVPDLVVGTRGEGSSPTDGIIIAFNGTTGEERWRIEHDPANNRFGSYGRATVGIADVNDNDIADVVYAGRPLGGSASSPTYNHSRVYAVDGNGTLLWASRTFLNDPHYLYVRHGAPAFGNFDSDPAAETVFGASIIDDNGVVVWDQEVTELPPESQDPLYVSGALFGSNGADGTLVGYGSMSAIADLTGDGYPEIVSGRHAWSVSWVEDGGPPDVEVTLLWDAGGPDGYPGIADFDLDGTPEVALVGEGTLRILEGETGELWCGIGPGECDGNDAARTPAIALPSGGRGGAPTIADFDGDGRPEVGSAGAAAYTVFDFARPDEDIVQPEGDLPPGPGDIFVRWSMPTQDESSNNTGSSVFDFQGDGLAEVLYGDECYLRVYNGSTGAVILEIEQSSTTAREYPIVVDVDADNNSEIIAIANDFNAVTADPNTLGDCEDIPGYTAKRGVFVYGDPNDQWVRTRRVWSSHTYHVTNSDPAGLVPSQEDDNWSVPGLNNYRQNVQGEGVFNAPDLSVELAVDFDTCLDEEFTIRATVRNGGSLGIPAGVNVSLYEGDDASGELVGTEPTTQALLPGAFEVIEWEVPAPGGQEKRFYVEVDDAEGNEAAVLECNEDNNTANTVTVSCPTPG